MSRLDVVVIGSGYAGITLACLTKFGHSITLVDIDKEKADMISKGFPPIYEAGLEEVLQYGLKEGRLKATTDFSCVKDADVVFICVGTPSKEDGSIDLSQIESSARSIGEAMKDSDKYKVVVLKSTALPNTVTKTVIPTVEEASGKEVGKDFGACMNPEFLREGTAVKDFMEPEKIVIGGVDGKSQKVISDLYSKFDQSIPRIFTDTNTAEMIKYANNAMLATRVSFINEIANICEHYGVDIKDVSNAIGADPRIGPKFLNAGIGFGGSCFPKDVRALISAAHAVGLKPGLLENVIEINDKQAERMVDLAEKTIGDLTDKKISVLGLSFKAGTDDMRESRAVPVIQSLLRKHAKVKAYDPKAVDNAKKIFDDMVTFAPTVESCLEGSDIVFVTTEWPEFKEIDFSNLKVPVIDGRRLLDPEKVTSHGVVYRGIGWKNNFGGVQ